MANQKISGLPTAGVLTGAEVTVVVQAANNFKLSLATLIAYINANMISFSSSTGGIVATNVGAALRELQDELLALTAEQVAFKSTTGGIVASTVGGALREVQDEQIATQVDLNAHKVSATAHNAADITFSSTTGGILSTNVAAALKEVESDVTNRISKTGLEITEPNVGANRQGLAVLVAGTTVVATTAVAINSRVFLTTNTPGGTVGFVHVSARTPGVSFTITSSSGADTSSVAWILSKPI